MLIIGLFLQIIAGAAVIGMLIAMEIWLAGRKNRYAGGILPIVLLLICVLLLVDSRNGEQYVVSAGNKEYYFESEKELEKKTEELKSEQMDFNVEQMIYTKEQKIFMISTGAGAFVLFAVCIYIRKKSAWKRESYKMQIKDL